MSWLMVSLRLAKVELSWEESMVEIYGENKETKVINTAYIDITAFG